MREIWKDVVGYEGIYMISNLGRVKSLPRKQWNGWAWWQSEERILIPRCQKGGGHYYSVQLSKNNKKTNMNIHRLVAEHFLPNPNDLPYVNHKDENKLNNNVNNLEWCTSSYNATYGKMKDINRKKRKQILFVDNENNISFTLDTLEQFKECGFNKGTARTNVNRNKKYFGYEVSYISNNINKDE